MSEVQSSAGIRRGQSLVADARDAVREFHAAVVQADMALVLFFCSSDYDLVALADEMHHLFGEVPVIGCTTAGEIGPAGYLEQSITGVSFPASSFSVVSHCLEPLQQFCSVSGQAVTRGLMQQLERQAPRALTDNCFALLLIDGLSGREEQVTRIIQSALGKIPLVGGSAADGVDFVTTHVYFQGGFHADCGVLTLLSTPLPIQLFETQHFSATNERLVVTEADTDRRVVKEINGFPAAQEYARILGVAVHELSHGLFAARPVVVLINGQSYVRSIQKVNQDGSLKFYCAIENGLILRVAKGGRLLENLDRTFARIRETMGRPQLVIGCDCLLRRLEIFRSSDKERIVELLLQNNTTGFSTYGEQFRGLHVNQTLVGVAIGSELPGVSDD